MSGKKGTVKKIQNKNQPVSFMVFTPDSSLCEGSDDSICSLRRVEAELTPELIAEQSQVTTDMTDLLCTPHCLFGRQGADNMSKCRLCIRMFQYAFLEEDLEDVQSLGDCSSCRKLPSQVSSYVVNMNTKYRCSDHETE